MINFKCDRCKQEAEQVYIVEVRYATTDADYHSYRTIMPDEGGRIDLCPTCYKRFRKWIESEND